MKRLSITFFACLFSFVALAGKIDKAFEALQSYNYFEAKELFYKILDKEPIAASFGLSVIYARTDNPFHQFDSAYLYVGRAEMAYARNQPDVKAREKLQELGADSIHIQDWKDQIDQSVFQLTLKANSISQFQWYIDVHYDSDQRPKAIYKRDSLAFDEAKASNLSTDYRLFLASFPASSFVAEAKNRLDERLFFETVQRGSIKGYSAFLENNPESPFLSQAEDSLYVLATNGNDLKRYYDFVYRYPKNRNVENAWRMLYTLYTSDGNPERIVEFRLDYPDYPYVDELVIDFKLAAMKFYPYQKEGLWGFVDENGAVRISPQYDFVAPFHMGVALAIKEDKIGYISKANEVLVPFEYEDGEDYQKGLMVVMKGEYLGMINKANQIVLPFEYDEIGRLDQELILVSKDNLYGYVNQEGKIQIPFRFSRAYDFQGAYALAKDSGRFGMINQMGAIHIPFRYQFLEPYNEYGVCRAKQDSLFGLLDQNGGIVLPYIYSHLGEAKDSLLLVAKDGKYGYAHVGGEIRITPKYDFAPEALVWGSFDGGYTKYKQKGKYGIINWRGDRIFPTVFEDIGEYNDSSLIAVKKRGKWGYSNQRLSLAIPYNYEAAKTFRSEFAAAKKDGSWFLIDKKGKEKAGPFEKLEQLPDQKYRVKTELGWGLLSSDGAFLVPCLYTRVEAYRDTHFRFTRKEGTQYFDLLENKVLISDSGLQ